MFKDSYFLSFLVWLLASLKNSFIFRFIKKTIDFLANSFNNSKVKGIFVSGKELEKYCPSSRAMQGLSKFKASFVSAIDKFSALCKDSVFGRLIHKLRTHSVIIKNLISVPFLCCVIFVIPHDLWNNLFAMVIACMVLVMAIAKRPENEKKLPAIWFCMILFGISLLVSLLASYDIKDSVRTLMFFITAFVLCIAINIYISDTKRLAKFMKWMFFAVVITSLVAFAQRIIGIEASTEFTDPTLNEGMPGRAFSTLGNPNNFAEFLMLFIPFTFAYAVNKKEKKQKFIHLAGVILAVGALLLTYSRSGWIAFAVALLIYVILYDIKYLPYLAVIVILLIPMLPQSILNRILTIGNLEDTSSSYRLHIWTGCLSMLRDHWLAGVGLGSGGFQEIFPPYSIMSTSAAPHSHMQFLEMFIELGIVGFITYVCFTFTTIRRTFCASICTDEFLRNSVIASAASMSGIILIGFFEYCWFYPRVLFAFFVCIGVCMASVRLSKQTHNGKEE